MTGKRGFWGFRYDTTHPKINHYKMHLRFLSAKWNAATRYSARPFTTKTGARVLIFCLNSPRNRGWYQARVHPFSSGNGKGDIPNRVEHSSLDIAKFSKMEVSLFFLHNHVYRFCGNSTIENWGMWLNIPQEKNI